MADRENRSTPFDEDIMTIMMGVSPDEPGPHGRMDRPAPGADAIGFVTQIRDMCEEFLRNVDKGGERKDFGDKDFERGGKDKFDRGDKDFEKSDNEYFDNEDQDKGNKKDWKK